MWEKYDEILRGVWEVEVWSLCLLLCCGEISGGEVMSTAMAALGGLVIGYLLGFSVAILIVYARRAFNGRKSSRES